MPTGVYKRNLKPIIKKGDRYNRLTAVKFYYKDKKFYQYWLFRCDCGNEKVLKVNNVRKGNTGSCGCLSLERKTKHGMYGTKVYKSWMSMKERCFNKKNKHYKDYGGRGITVCKKWKNSFENFYTDMGDRPKEKSLDRIKNNLGYYKDNCRWATLKEQNNNKRNNRFLTYENKTQTIAQWSKELNINDGILRSRLTREWSIKNALEM